jgi:hypothetical protein
MALFTTALGLYGGVLWSGELQGFVIHEMMPICLSTPSAQAQGTGPRGSKGFQGILHIY